tara:strand:+ start:594 stop:938 length:345 start_codon:yes stop_codon:yes gene_type:complete
MQESIALKAFKAWLIPENLKTINHIEIGWKGMYLDKSKINENCICCKGERYYKCNINLPCIVADNVLNPHGKKYRLIDGKHRINCMRDLGITSSQFYVITKEAFFNCLNNSTSL